jgi:serine phosphatase RsbU (regulator of sigma subunit)
MKKVENFFGYAGVTLLFLGVILKKYHFPGGSPMLALSALFFAFFYCTTQLIGDWREKEGKFNKLYILVRFFTYFLGYLGVVFKILHWPGASVMLYPTMVLLPTFLVMYFIGRKKDKFSLSNIHRDIVLAVILVSAVFIIEIGSVSKSMLNVFVLYEQEYEKVNDAIDISTNIYVENLLQEALDSNSSELVSIEMIQERTDSMLAHIHSIRTELIRVVENVPIEMADTLSTNEIYISNLTTFSVPTYILIGDPSAPRGGKHSALYLKERINRYLDIVNDELQKNGLVLATIGMGLEMKDVYNSHIGESEPWEVYKFSHIPLGGILSYLANLKNLILLTESNAIVALGNNISVSENVKDLKIRAQQGAQIAIAKQEQELIEIRYKRELEEVDNKKKEVEYQQQNTLLAFVFFGGAVMLILLILATRGFILKQRSNKKLNAQNDEINKQNEAIEEKNTEILDSMNYAQRIQNAILPPQRIVKEYLKESFILYKPKDIVAGDFYWMEPVGDTIIFAAADCTGHGVPGAMVSVVCHNALNRAVREFGLTQPAKILDKVRELVIETFDKSDEDVKDGMDIGLVSLNFKTKELQFSGANNSLYHIKNVDGSENEKDMSNGKYFISEIKPDKQPIGNYTDIKSFTNHSLLLKEGEGIYVFTDGYADQFGGVKGKKFKYKPFKNLLLDNFEEPMEAQHEIMDVAFESWRGVHEQVDDVCIIGVRI